MQNHLKENKSFDNFRGDEFFEIVFTNDRINKIYYGITGLIPHGLSEEEEEWFNSKIVKEIAKQKT